MANRRLARIVSQVTAGQEQRGSSVHALQHGATVAVTGAAGFVGGWIVRYCLDRGYTVRACVRNLDDENKVGFLKRMPEFGGKLSLHGADMTVAGAYDTIFHGCSTVFHPAEVFMSFSDGRDPKRALDDFSKSSGSQPEKGGIHKAALTSSQHIVDSINKSGTVTRLIYTSSIAALMGGPPDGDWASSPLVNETHLPASEGVEDYGGTKRLTEKFFDFQAQLSGGRWDVITGNPGDIVGPILSSHQAVETWQGKIARIVQGIPVSQEPGGRPWMLVDVRDVAEAEISLAESKTVQGGSRFILASCDKVPPEDLGKRVMEFEPNWDCATCVAPRRGCTALGEVHPGWYRIHLDNTKVRTTIGFQFRSFETTLKATVSSLVTIGSIKPKLKDS